MLDGKKIITNIIDDYTRPIDLAGAAALLNELGEAFDIQFVTYFGNGAAIYPSGSLLLTNYPRKWQKAYFDNGYEAIDPVLKSASRTVVPIDWGRIDAKDDLGSGFFEDAQMHGLGPNGLTIPIRGPSGEIAFLSLNGHGNYSAWKQRWEQNLSDYIHFAFRYHAILTLSLQCMSPPLPKLSKREEEVMRWSIQGKSAWEIGTLLGLSPRTIESYIRNICLKLNVSNKAQAVARVVGERLLND